MAKKETKNKKENNKNKKSFSKDFKAELKRVSWPTPKQLLNNTVAVITIVLVTAAIVFVLDLTFETLNKYGVNKIKEVISTSNTTSDESANNEKNTEATNENAESENNSENNAE
ncbi:MAG: preprotein translocase subunit SecE [Clostridia bacterium]|nr:preprotein translocase subunit SecE [Clostridia bacterium]